MKNTYLITGLIAVVAAGAAFTGGSAYQKHKDSLTGISAQALPGKLQELGYAPEGGAIGFGNRGGAGRRGTGAPIIGQIINKDDQSVTVKLQDGSTKTVYVSASTAVGLTVAGSAINLAVGKQITANGTANSDGSLAASSIQIRPLPTPSPTPAS